MMCYNDCLLATDLSTVQRPHKTHSIGEGHVCVCVSVCGVCVCVCVCVRARVCVHGGHMCMRVYSLTFDPNVLCNHFLTFVKLPIVYGMCSVSVCMH